MAAALKFPMLVIDAGNSAVKFASIPRPGGRPKLLGSMAMNKLTPTAVRRLVRDAGSVFVSSVVPSATRVLKRALPAARFIGPDTPLDFKTLAGRKSIGSDRLANVAAAHARHGKNVLVASFGTAATFDIIDAKGVHRGGALAPGWKAFAEIFPSKTALLPRVGAKVAPRYAGRNTREALAAGVAGGYAALVQHLIEGMKNEAGAKNARVIFTGGDAPVVAKLLRLKGDTDPLLTMCGIAHLGGSIAREVRK
ncbi:MAG: type III pantothenate kinase [Chthoniobacterales bacterium]|nr:type III pantothenate kinase [Chthoniobacterales bacterium]